jgi:hypothetical protein
VQASGGVRRQVGRSILVYRIASLEE